MHTSIYPIRFTSTQPIKTTPALQNTNFGRTSAQEIRKMDTIPSYALRPPFLGKSESSVSGYRTDIEKALEQKIVSTEIINSRKDMPVTERLTMENGTIFKKATGYYPDGRIYGFSLQDITADVENPRGKLHSLFDYSDQLGAEGICFVKLYNEKGEQYHGFYQETELR